MPETLEDLEKGAGGSFCSIGIGFLTGVFSFCLAVDTVWVTCHWAHFMAMPVCWQIMQVLILLS